MLILGLILLVIGWVTGISILVTLGVILLLIGGVVVTEWFAEAFRLAAFGDPDAGWAIAAYPLSLLLAGLLEQAGIAVER